MTTETLRLFFALWPDAAVQAGLAEWGKKLSLSLGGRLTRHETIHLTIAFIGDTLQSRLDEVRLIGDELKAARFEMQFDTIGCFNRNGIAWAAPESTPGALLQLVGDLRDRLRKAGFPIESRPYTPHVTLLRKAKCRPIERQPEGVLTWQARDFVLVRSALSADGPSYLRLGGWPLD